MTLFRRNIPILVAVLSGLLTLLGLLALPVLADLMLEWAVFLAAVALILGVLNLFLVHLRRSFAPNGYSLLLILSMLGVFALAVSDDLGITSEWLDIVFTSVLVPLEAAVASLLAFFLLFAGIRILQRQRGPAILLFVLAALFFLISQSPLPAALSILLEPVRNFLYAVLVTAGVRGLLLGVALGTVTLSLRLLGGLERPYSP